MRSDQLNNWQTHALKNKIGQLVEYLTRLRQRMEHRGFPLDDQLYLSVKRAELALHDLHAKCQCLAKGVNVDVQESEPPRLLEKRH